MKQNLRSSYGPQGPSLVSGFIGPFVPHPSVACILINVYPVINFGKLAGCWSLNHFAVRIMRCGPCVLSNGCRLVRGVHCINETVPSFYAGV
ncbi:hypothetical protein FRX31_023919 [Thalictrum thalictroides]|uniref:Uncharacterized protein n=1 Tax=Thalictrum thalictroides TaxID=46969 RepID=A0A7J6VN26_THATH|nr:hypothetical protein FRX31_023919 [Thalictrum thalictroides]